MDNKKDRQFYWEVKDFCSKSITPVSKDSTNSLKESIKSILQKNEPYKVSSFDKNSNAVDITKNTISHIQKNESGYNPSSVAHSKNLNVNAFQQINEGYWDDFKQGLQAVGDMFTTKRTSQDWSASKTSSAKEAKERAQKIRSGMSALEKQATYTTSNLPELSKEIDIEELDYKPGTKLTPEQKAKREVEGQLAGEKAEEEIRQTEAERIVASAPETQTTPTGSWFSPKPSWAPKGDTTVSPAVSIPTSTSPDAGAPQTPSSDIVGVDITQQTPEQIAAMNDPSRGGQSGRFGGDKKPTVPSSGASDAEKQKYLEARKAYWTRRNAERRQEAEDNLARTQFGKPRSAYQAGQMAANKLQQQRAAEGSKDWSEEKIARMAEKETELRFRTPEQREAKRKENEAVVASLARAAEEVRAKEAKEKTAQKTMTASKTESPSKTSPKTYRI